MNNLPLEGIRLLDFTWIAQGPYVCRLLAYQGAEVLKIQTRRRRDPSFGPDARSYWALNLSKKSCTINIATPEGVDLIKRVIGVSDVMVENMATGVFERLGLGYDEVKQIKPDIIYVSSSGMGREGPRSKERAWGSLLQGYSGWSSLTGYPGKIPTVGSGWTDPVTAYTSFLAIMAALRNRIETGHGQYVDISMLEATAALMPEPLMDFVMNRRNPAPIGYRDASMAPHNVYPCQGLDKWVAIAVTNDEEWQALCGVMGRPELAQDPRFADGQSRWRYQEELDGIIGQWTRNYTHIQVMETLQKAGVPAGASYNAAEVYTDPHYKARGLITEYQDHEGQPRAMYTVPWKLRDSPRAVVFASPDLEAYNEYVFRELLGMEGREIERLVETQVIY